MENCKDCKDDIKICSKCDSDYQLIYEDGKYQCKKCGENCKQCPDSAEKCQLCNNGYGLVIGKDGVPGKNCQECKIGCQECADNAQICRKCLEGYGFKLGPKGEQTGECEKCSENCDACVYDSSRCLRCKDGYGFIHNADGTSTGKCGPCPADCRRCYKDNSMCNDCRYGFGFKVENDGTITNTCERCPDNCVSCTLSNNCDECAPNFGFVIDLSKPNTIQCRKCINNCENCKYDASYCEDCSEFFYHEKGADGLYTGKCISCPKYCSICSETGCTNCKTGFDFYTDENGQKSKDCQPCPENCSSCSNSATCTGCYTGFKLDDNKKCVFKSIEHCIEIGERGCRKCESGYELSNNDCVECPNNKCPTDTFICQDGYSFSYYGSNYGKCFACPTGCYECDVDVNKCYGCFEGFTFKRNGNNITDECIPCPPGCESCEVDPNYCEICKEKGYGLVIENGVNTRKCARCADPFCRFCPRDNTICLECEDHSYMDHDKNSPTYGKCVSLYGRVPECAVENCFKCEYENPIQCMECFDDFCLYDDGNYKKCLPCQKECNVENCKQCIFGHSDQCMECNDGFCVNEDSTSKDYKKCVSCDIPCKVENCQKCISGSSDKCKECNDGYTVSGNGQCTEPLDGIDRPDFSPEYIVVDDSEISEDGNFVFDGSKYILKDDKNQITIKLDSKKISTITINSNPAKKDLAVEITDSVSDITILLKDSNSGKNFDIVTSGQKVTINLDGNTRASIKQGQGEVEIKGAKNADKVTLNQVQPLTKSFSLIPSVPVEIDVVDFNEEQGLLVQSPDSSKVTVKTLKVQQTADAEIQNATITSEILFGLSSSLKINEFVNLAKSSLNLPFNLNSEESNKAFIRGILKSNPDNIKITNRQVGTLSQDRYLLAESSESFDCETWKSVSTIEVTNSQLNGFECKNESSNGRDVYRLYAIQGKSEEDPSKDGGNNGNKLSAGAIAGIVIAVVVVVGAVVFVLVYFLVIKKRRSNESSGQEGQNENDANEV